MIVVLLDLRVELVAHLLVDAHPQVAAVGEHVALVHKREHLLFAVALARDLVGVLHTALDHRSRVLHDLRGDFQRGALLGHAADAGVDAA